VRFVDPDRTRAAGREAVDERTKLVFAETIGNPKINVVDIAGVGRRSPRPGLPLIVDNTAPTPYLCRVFDHGADVSVHSATKYIGGHGTSIGGVIVDAGSFDWAGHAERFPGLTSPTRPTTAWCGPRRSATSPTSSGRARSCCATPGAAIAPLNSFLFLQGLETLHLRMERHSENALAVARFLEGHDAVSWVSYPGLESSPYKATPTRCSPAAATADW
jgi:O-acetylhomoserine (thiol)-lyase